ncbi:MAG: glycoside hydrolase family 3 N-terminal domain-containing protein, partial [Bacteroidales bacterium]
MNRLLAMKYLLCPRALMCLIYVCCVAVPISALAQDEHQNKRIAKQVDSVFSTMSLREKVAQLFIVDFVSNNGIKVKSMQNRLVRNEKVGGLITMNDKMVPALQRLNELNRFATIPLLVSIDGEWGVSMRYKEIPSFPKQMQLGALTSESLIYKMGYAIGKECLALKIHVNFAPDVDINNNPDNPAINT